MKQTVPESVQECGPRAIQIYFDSIADGDSPRMAEMLACRQPPGLVTDTSIVSTFGSLRSQLGNSDDEVRCCEEACRKQGFTPTDNYVYNPMLADFRFDKKAFVPKDTYRASVKKACIERGVSTQGTIKTKGRQPDSDPHKVRVKLPD